MNDLVERQQSDNEDTVLAALDDIVQNIRLGGRIDEHGVHVIMGYLACNNRRVRMQAKLTLAAIGQPAVPALIAALADPLRSQMAKHTFGMMPERIAIPVLIGALYHDNPAIVAGAQDALTNEMPDPREALAAVLAELGKLSLLYGHLRVAMAANAGEIIPNETGEADG